jgi:hypothetical protein
LIFAELAPYAWEDVDSDLARATVRRQAAAADLATAQELEAKIAGGGAEPLSVFCLPPSNLKKRG